MTIYDAGVDISQFTLGNRDSGGPLDRQRILWMIESPVEEPDRSEMKGLMDFFEQFHAGNDPAILTFRQLTPQEEHHIYNHLELWVSTIRSRSANELEGFRFSMVDGSVIGQLLETHSNRVGSTIPQNDPQYLKSMTLTLIRMSRMSLRGQPGERNSLNTNHVLLIFLIQEYPLSHRDL